MAENEYTVKKVKSIAGPDGPVSSCDLYRAGCKVAAYFNDGSGGCGEFQWQDRAVPPVKVAVTWEDGSVHQVTMTPEEARLHVHVRTLTYTAYGETHPQDEDFFLAALMDEWEIKRLCQRHTVFRLQDTAADTWLHFNVPFTPAVRVELEQRYGDQLVEFANVRYNVPVQPAQ